MTIQLQKTVTETREIPVPCFWKKHYSYYAIIDENNAYRVSCIDNYYSVTAGDMKTMGSSNLDYFHKDAKIISEDQFFSAYTEARQATELTPVLTEPAHRTEAEQHRKTVTSY